eukprot:gnl/TRDRNA2_/TRDRNA2_150146_c0_seq1.p3 gnl/TRDRNA2_/TRDRNA2_150146_c0~~gnl/TRDRNA2_/TRDRNA2_150146_c0_seq1.p3  ORF type:complete len:103 (+),score=10.19 gnl/TRDRNA2_/TRDRNA2_150146_c0_seq1:322-630(+)
MHRVMSHKVSAQKALSAHPAPVDSSARTERLHFVWLAPCPASAVIFCPLLCRQRQGRGSLLSGISAVKFATKPVPQLSLRWGRVQSTAKVNNRQAAQGQVRK